MAEELEIQKKAPEKEEKPARKFPVNTKILIYGIPAFIIQLIIVYFITANFLISKIPKNTQPAGIGKADSTKTAKVAEEPKKAEFGKYIFQIEDIIVNPADTQGKRLILTSIGFDVAQQDAMAELKSKEVLLKDVIVTTISGKTLAQLSNSIYKDTLKTEIFSKVKHLLPDSKLNTVYISKYIIQ
jgi:flagellar FliL protein